MAYTVNLIQHISSLDQHNEFYPNFVQTVKE